MASRFNVGDAVRLNPDVVCASDSTTYPFLGETAHVCRQTASGNSSYIEFDNPGVNQNYVCITGLDEGFNYSDKWLLPL